MVTDRDIISLRNACERRQSLEVVFEYGPLRAHADNAPVQQLWHEPIDPAVALVSGTSRKAAMAAWVEELRAARSSAG